MSASLPEGGTETGTKLVELPVSEITANERNPRLIFPQEELDRLCDSIDQEGILVPVTVFRKIDHYVLVDGERRFRCARKLGLDAVPALVVDEKPEHEVLLQMFNIHLVREPWQDMPTAKALAELVKSLTPDGAEEPSDARLHELTGLSVERVRQLRYVVTLPKEWQSHIGEGTIKLNFFWELKRNVIDALANLRPRLYTELGGWEKIGQAFVDKRLDGVITDTVGLRKVRPIINFAREDAGENEGSSFLDETIRDLVKNRERSIDDAYEDTVQIMVEADKLDRRTAAMIISFERLFGKVRTEEDRRYIVSIGENLIARLSRLLHNE
jgi:ParB family transcriptional regulator, chromosome partitioning protein